MPVHIPQVPAGEDEWPEGLPNLLKYGKKEEDGEEKQGDDDEEEGMEGKRRDEEDIQDSLVEQKGMIVKFPLVPLLQLLLQGSFQQEEVEQPHCRDTQIPNIMNYLVPDHLPLATLPEQ